MYVSLSDEEIEAVKKSTPRNCENCEGHYDDSDDVLGPRWYRCSIKPHMENLVGFPFKSEQKCFQLAWWATIDWEKTATEQENDSYGVASNGRS